MSEAAELFGQFPHLASPAALARADLGERFRLPPHLDRLNLELMGVGFGDTDRLAVNVPFQHGKSWLSSHYFPAWKLLLSPETRFILAANSDNFAAGFGSKVKAVIERFGKPLGVSLKKDTRAKDEWAVEGYDGGLVCRGWGGNVVGRPADCFLVDDLIKNPEEALSSTTLEKMWDWYCTVAFSRLGPTAPIAVIGTRWCKGDLFGRLAAEEADGGEKWRRVVFPAIALEGDPLGRKPGEALWPERVPLARLQMVQRSRGRWFNACWQQMPDDEQGQHFNPEAWPVWVDAGDCYLVLPHAAAGSLSAVRRVMKDDLLVFCAMDWAWSVKTGADHTAVVVFGLTPAADLLILDVVNARFGLRQLAPALAAVCKFWSPAFVAAEAGHPTFAEEYRTHPEIPPVVFYGSGNKKKLIRALPAVFLAENGRLVLPRDQPPPERCADGKPWKDPYCRQLKAFSGADSDHDDMVDATAHGCAAATQVQPRRPAGRGADGPACLTPPREGE